MGLSTWTTILDLIRCASAETGIGAGCITESSNRGAQGAGAAVTVLDAYSTLTVPIFSDVTTFTSFGYATYIYNGDAAKFARELSGSFRRLHPRRGVNADEHLVHDDHLPPALAGQGATPNIRNTSGRLQTKVRTMVGRSSTG